MELNFFMNSLGEGRMKKVLTQLFKHLIANGDRATMGVSLEGRDPLLDHKILEWSSKLPLEFKYKDGKTKYILRRILYKYLPRELVDRKKQGFGVPIQEWFKNELKDLYREYLSEEAVKRVGVFDEKEVKKLLKGYWENKGVNHKKVWLLFIFQQWAERWLI